MKGICIFASGTGTNADRIMEHFSDHKEARVELVVCDRPGAGVLEYAHKHGVKSMLITKSDLAHPDELIRILRSSGVNVIVLAGFLRLLPTELVAAFPDRIVNIHPSLLPKYGGKGMYGSNVHRAVLDAKEAESGITIHLVNERYDDGQVLFQAKCAVLPEDTPETLASRIHELEYEHYPVQVEHLIHA